MNGNQPFVVTLKRSLVSWDLFVRAQTKSSGWDQRPDYTSFLQEKVRCSCQSMLNFTNNGDRAVQCPKGDGTRLKLDEIDRHVLIATAKRLSGVTAEFREGVEEQLDRLEQAHEARNAKRSADIAALSLQIKDVYRNLITMDERAVEIGNELLREVIDKKERLEKQLSDAGSMPRLVLPDEDAALALSNELEALVDNLPLRPDTPDDERMLEKLSDFILEVQVKKTEGENYDLTILFNDISGEEPAVASVVVADCNIGVKAHNKVVAAEYVRTILAESAIRMTDAEWESFPVIKAIRKKTQQIRDQIDAILIWNTTDINVHRLMKNMGYGHVRARGVPSFFARARNDLITHFRKTRGNEFDLRLRTASTRANEAARMRSCFHPVFLLPISRSDTAVTELDDAQWTAIAGLLEAPHQKATVLTYREVLNGYFALLRSEYVFTQADLVGLKKSHADLIPPLHASGKFNRIVEALLKLEGYLFPDDYVMPSRPLGFVDKLTVPALAEVLRTLSEGFAPADIVIPVPAPPPCNLLVVENLVLNVDASTVTTKGGELVRLKAGQFKLVKLLFERPETIITLDDLRQVGDHPDRARANDVTVCKRLVALRRALRPHCPATAKAIVSLKGGVTFIFTRTPEVQSFQFEARRPTPYVEKGPTTLVQKIVEALKDGRNIPSRMEDLDFLLGGPARQAKHTSLPRRVAVIQSLLMPIYPKSSKPLRHLARRRRTKGSLGDVHYEPTELGRRVRHALGLPNLTS